MCFKSNSRAVGYDQGMCATSALLGLSYHVGGFVGSYYYICVGLLNASLLWKFPWLFLVPWKLVLRKEALCLKCIISLVWTAKGNTNSMQGFGSHLGNSFLQLKRGLLTPLVCVCAIGGLWLLEGALPAQMWKFHLNHICLFIYRLICSIVLFRWILNGKIPYDVSRHPYSYFTHFRLSLSASPP